MVGPLPIQKGLTHHEELNYIFTSGRGRINVYNADGEAIAAFNLKIGTEIKDITKELLNGSTSGTSSTLLILANFTQRQYYPPVCNSRLTSRAEIHPSGRWWAGTTTATSGQRPPLFAMASRP
ncbi:hypothetical protein LB505_011668 [Fusarium chuoi]|nr:hypothetical protein LB505_011668 [Fusarium chuoi]